MTKKEIANLLHSLEELGLKKHTLFRFANGLNVIKYLGYAKALEIYMQCKYDLVEFYEPRIEEEDGVCDLDNFIFDIVETSLRVLGLILQNDYEDFKDEDRLFMEASEAYYVYPNNNAFVSFFEEHGFCVYRIDIDERSYYMLYDRELGMYYRNYLAGECVSLNAVKESIEELFELLEDEFFEELDREETLKSLKEKLG